MTHHIPRRLHTLFRQRCDVLIDASGQVVEIEVELRLMPRSEE